MWFWRSRYWAPLQVACQSASSAPGTATVDCKCFVLELKNKWDLSIPVKAIRGDLEYTSNVAEHPKSLHLEGSIVHVLEEGYKEWQDKGRIRCFGSADDQKHKVNVDHFKKFCSSLQLNENIEECIMVRKNKIEVRGVRWFMNLIVRDLSLLTMSLEEWA